MTRAPKPPKNRFVRNATIDERTFITILQAYLHLLSAPQARELLEAHPDAMAVSTKTIARYYRRIGTYLFFKVVEPAWLALFPQVAPAKERSPEAYETLLSTLAETTLKFADGELDYETFRILNDGAEPMVSKELERELRMISAARKGIKDDARADLGLAHFRNLTAKHIAADADQRELESLMLQTVLQWLGHDPLR